MAYVDEAIQFFFLGRCQGSTTGFGGEFVHAEVVRLGERQSENFPSRFRWHIANLRTDDTTENGGFYFGGEHAESITDETSPCREKRRQRNSDYPMQHSALVEVKPKDRLDLFILE